MSLTTLAETSSIPNACTSQVTSEFPPKANDLVGAESNSDNASPEVAPEIKIVDTLSILESCISQLALSKSIAADLEGINLSRDGRICIIQLFAEGSNTVWLVDVTMLGEQALNYANEDGHSIKTILESPDIMKLFFDVRNDADALFNLFGVDMKNVFDVQLLDIAYRRRGQPKKHGKFLSGLGKCVATYLSMPPEWCMMKAQGRRLFVPELGGSFEIFERRPLDEKLVKYCAQYATILFDLRDKMQAMMGSGYKQKGWDERIKAASSERVNQSKYAVDKGQPDDEQPDEGLMDGGQMDKKQPDGGQLPVDKGQLDSEVQPDKEQRYEGQLDKGQLDTEQLDKEHPDKKQPDKERRDKRRRDRSWILAPIF